MSSYKPKLPASAQPTLNRPFDPWNSVSTGHQRAEARGAQGWRESRNMKLRSQFVAGHLGGKRIADSVGAGAEEFDEKLGVFIPKEARARAMNSVVDMLRNPSTMRPSSTPSLEGTGPKTESLAQEEDASLSTMIAEERLMAACKTEDEARAEAVRKRGIFDGLVIYVNGSTHPLISDHKLKRLLSEHGARMSLHLGRRQVTHVILGKPAGPNSGAGGGLAGGKLDKEIRRVGGCGVKYVGVEW